MNNALFDVETYIIERLETLYKRKKQCIWLEQLAYEMENVPFFIAKKAVKKLVKEGKITVVIDNEKKLLFLTGKKYDFHCVKTSKNKKPCKDCPYRIGQVENFYALKTEENEYNGSIVHDCHKLNKNYKSEDDELGCIGSSWFGMKINDIHSFDNLKELEEMIYPK